MKIVRKTVITLVKWSLFFMPKQWREAARQNPTLLALYTRNLQKVGLLNLQLQDAKQALFAYNHFLIQQADKINQQLRVLEQQELGHNSIDHSAALSLLICVADLDFKALNRTIDSVKKQQAHVSIVLFWCHEKHKTALAQHLAQHLESPYCLSSQLTELISEPQIAEQPGFILFSGDLLQYGACAVLPSLIAPGSKLAYVDTDTYTPQENRTDPDFKPDWNPDLQLSTGYVHTGLWLDKLKHFSDLSMAVSPFSVSLYLCHAYFYQNDKNVQHIPMTFVSRPMQSTTFIQAKAQFDLLSRPFLKAKLSAAASLSQESENPVRVLSLRWHLAEQPLVSIIIPTRNSRDLVQNCINSILEKTTYSEYEILLVDNGSDDPSSIAYFEELNAHPKISVLSYQQPFNYSAINNFAAKQANGQILALVNNDIEVISADWLLDMVCHVWRDDIGCVGAKLLYPDNRVQHAGVVLGYGGGAGHAHKYFPADHPGYMNRLIASQNYSAVTAACLLVKTKDYWAIQGLNEKDLTVAFNDVDFCLRILQLGKRNLYCAEAILYHHESVSRGHEDTPEKVTRFQKEVAYLQATWANIIAQDPAYNPNLTLKKENFEMDIGSDRAIFNKH